MTLEESIKQIEHIYQSINIYHALYVYDEKTDYDDAIISSLKNENYPILEWTPGVNYLHTHRILVIQIQDLEKLCDDIHMFTLAMTCCDRVFFDLLRNPLCENLTVIKI